MSAAAAVGTVRPTRRALTAAMIVSAIAVTAGVLAPPPSVVTADTVAEQAGAAELAWPQRRFASCGAYDTATSTLLAFGGRAEGGQTHLGDAWSLHLEAGERPEWQQTAVGGATDAPPPGRSCAAAFDPVDQRLLVFGGWNGVTMQNGVWALDVTAGSWSRLCDATSCGTAPTPRRAAQMVYDAARRRVVMIGGLDGAYRNDVWELSLDGDPRWAPLTVAGAALPVRAGHSLVADAERDRVWMFGGTRPGSDLGDTWYLDLATATWHAVACATDCPTARSGATLVHDTGFDRLVLYGGWQSAEDRYPEEVWTLDDLGGAPRWTRLPIDSERPQPRFFHLAGYDPEAQRMVVFAGGTAGNAYKDSHALQLGEGSGAWRGIQPSTDVTARDQVAVTFDQRTRRLTAFGGFGSGVFPGVPDAGTHLADSFQIRPGAGGRLERWRNVTPVDPDAVPIAREATAYATDTAGHRLFLVGGLTGDIELNDVWVVEQTDTSRPQSRQLCSPTSCGSAPAPRWGGHAVFDPAGQQLVLFGGRGADGQAFDDTWVLELAGDPQWRRLQPSGPRPPARWGGAVALSGDNVLLFGGQTGPDGTGVPLGDTWMLSLTGGGEWSRLDLSTDASPSPRRSPAYASVPQPDGTSRLTVFGGLDATTGTHHNDVWTLSVTADGDASWTQLVEDRCAVSAKAAPICRRSASAVYDAVTGQLIVVFGRDGNRFVADLWRFDIATSRWIGPGGPGTSVSIARACRAGMVAADR